MINKLVGVNIESFLLDYCDGKICLSGNFEQVKFIRNTLALPYTDYYEEYVFMGGGKNLYLANRTPYSRPFMELIRIRQVEVSRLSEIYPSIKMCECCGRQL